MPGRMCDSDNSSRAGEWEEMHSLKDVLGFKLVPTPPSLASQPVGKWPQQPWSQFIR